jgi:TPP-dependent pyruvate/acetoin dehydrogenase alpha subunit
LYRPKEEVEQHWRDDPIARVEAMLRDAGLDAELETARMAARDEMQEAYRRAKDTPFPAVEHALADVQDIGDPRVEAF